MELPGPFRRDHRRHRADDVASTVRRILAADTIKPWQYRSWLFIRDPDFAAKATRVLDLYARVFDSSPLGDDEYVISSDEKTSIQARCRCHPTLPPGTSRTMRVNHEYERGGALAYLAAYDVHRAHMIGLAPTRPASTRSPISSMRSWRTSRTPPHAGCSGSSSSTAPPTDGPGRHRPLPQRGHDPHPRARLLAQRGGDLLSIVQRKVISPSDFTDLNQVQDRLTAFEQRYNATAQPFKWKFTPTDLKDLLARIERHEQKERTQQHEHDHQPAALAAA